MKYIGLMSFEPSLHGEAKELAGDKLESFSLGHQEDMPNVVDGEVHNLPEPQKDTIFVVNSTVFSAIDGSRPDIVKFDDTKVIRWTQEDAPNENLIGKVKSQGGFI